MSGLRLLQINDFYSPAGGTETYLLTILPALQQAGLEVGVMYAVSTGREFATRQWPEIYAPALSRKCALPISERKRLLAAEVERLNPDLIQLNKFDEPALVEWFCRGWPTVQFAHDQYPFSCPGDGKFLRGRREVCSRPVSSFCMIAPWLQLCGSRRPWLHLPRYFRTKNYLKAAAHLKRIIVASNYMREEMLLNGIPPEKVTVVRPPADCRAPLPGRPAEDRPAAGSAPASPPIVLFGGRLTEHKGCDLLLAAIAEVRAPCQLVIAGDGPERTRLEQLARQAPSRHQITFTGWLDSEALNLWYERATVVALPSLWPEPFGLMGLEAMAHARPVVALDRGGIGEWLNNEVNGFLVTDAGEFAEALERLLTDCALADRMGLAGYELLQEKFSLQHHIGLLLDLYRAAIETGKK